MIIFLNGPINSGKTTIANLLAKKINRVANVEIDALRDMIGWMPIDQAVPINLKNALSVIRNFSTEGLNVVVPYPLSSANYEYISSGLRDLNDKVYFFTLAPRLEKALSNRGNRELDEWERNRIVHHYDIGIHRPEFGETIDNSDLTPEETTNYILGKVLNSVG